MNTTDYITLTVTGVQYQTYVKEHGGSEAFLTEMGDDEREVVIKTEPDNPYDSRAARVEMDFAGYCCVGYVAAEELDIVHALLDEGKTALEGWVCGNDHHKTFFVAVPDADGKGHDALNHLYLWNTPKEVAVGKGLKIQIREDERRLETIQNKLVSLQVDSSNLDRFIQLTDMYLPLMLLYINKEDAVCRRRIYLKCLLALKGIKNGTITCTVEQAEKVKMLTEKVLDRLGDYHSHGGHYAVFKEQFRAVRLMAEQSGGFRDRYCKLHFKGDKGDVTKVKKAVLEKEIECVEEWLTTEIPDNIYALNYDNEVEFANQLAYANMSREGLYVVYAHYYTLLYLKEIVSGAAKSLPEKYSGEEDLKYWNALVAKGLLTENYMPAASTIRTALACIAVKFSMKKGGTKNDWKSFQNFWGINYLAQDYDSKLNKTTESQQEKDIDLIFKS